MKHLHLRNVSSERLVNFIKVCPIQNPVNTREMLLEWLAERDAKQAWETSLVGEYGQSDWWIVPEWAAWWGNDSECQPDNLAREL